jgi:hypothetical protein
MAAIPTTIDPTTPDGVYCRTHGNNAPAAYIGNERYGCWHCNPTREVGPTRRSACVDLPTESVSEIPDWML